MYESYFGLTERPFSIAPDPQYLYMSSRHREAMAHLSYGLSQGGCFIVLTGEVGTGKTTLCRNLLADLPDNVDVALILNANINEIELLQTLSDELGIEYDQSSSQKQLLDNLNQHLLSTFAQNRHTVLIIDEAQLLSRDVLEQIRLLTNLETTKSKLLQIILIGQPELNDLLARDDLRQLAQRITARYHLDALRSSEIEEYVNFRLGVAGGKQPLFSRQALNKLHSLTKGIPRKINVLADHALLAAYSKNQSVVDVKTIRTAASDVFIQHASESSGAGKGWQKWALGMILLLIVNLGLWWYFTQPNDAPEVPVAVIVDETAENEASDAPTTPVVTLQDTVAETEVQTAVSSKPNPGPAKVATDSSSDSAGTVVIAEEFLDDSPTLPDSVATDEQTAELVALTRAPVESDFTRILEASADLTGRITAFRELAELWSVNLPVQLLQPACQTLATQGLRCLSFANWEQLLRFNRPAIIVLNHQNQLHRVIVASVDADRASVFIGANQHQVAVAELRSMWNRNGVLFWRPDGVRSGLLQMGDLGNRVIATRNRLDRALTVVNMPRLESVTNPEFDLDLSQKVFALQSRFGIIGDSKIGAETNLLMNELLSPDTTPTLSQRN